MPNFHLLAAGIFLSLLTASKVTADFSPLQVGNEWAYRGQVKTGVLFGGPPPTQFREDLRLRVASRQANGDSVIWTIHMRDSLSERKAIYPYKSDTVFLRDTVLVGEMRLLEAGDSLIVLKPGRFFGHLSFDTFSIPLRAAMSYNVYFRHHSRPPGNASLLGLENGHRIWRTVLDEKPFFGAYPVTGWYVEDVGMYGYRMKVDAVCDGTVDRWAYLVRFNGQAIEVPDGVADFPAPLAKESGIACSIRPRPGGLAAFGGALRNGFRIDALGRRSDRKAGAPAD